MHYTWKSEPNSLAPSLMPVSTRVIARSRAATTGCTNIVRPPSFYSPKFRVAGLCHPQMMMTQTTQRRMRLPTHWWARLAGLLCARS